MFVSGGDLAMRHVTFEHTFASNLGGGVLAVRGQLTLYHADFINTTALTQVHAMFVHDAARVIAAFVTFRNHLCDTDNRDFGIINAIAPTPIALRNATFDTPDCLFHRSPLLIPSCSDAAQDHRPDAHHAGDRRGLRQGFRRKRGDGVPARRAGLTASSRAGACWPAPAGCARGCTP